MKQRKTLTDEQQTLYDALTKLQRACVDIKISDPLASYAEIYRRAKGMTDHDVNGNARRYGFNIMDHANVKAFLKSINVETIDDLIVSRNRVLNDLQDIAEVELKDIVHVVHEDDTLMNVDSGEMISGVKSFTIKRLEDIPDNAWKAIKKMEQNKYGIKVELHDTVAVRKVINEMQGYNAPVKTELTGKDGAPISIREMGDDEFAEELKRIGV